MNFKQYSNIIYISILVAFLPPKFFSQNLKIKFAQSFELDSVDYNSDALSYDIKGDKTYYAQQLGSKIKVFLNQPGKIDRCIFNLDKGLGNYFLDFVIDADEKNIFLLFQQSVQSYSLKQGSKTDELLLLSNLTNEVLLKKHYENIFFTEDKLVITRCYNFATAQNDTLYANFCVFNPSELRLLYEKNLVHDAIGFTHLSSYFFDVNYGKVLFVNALKNKTLIFDLNHFDEINFIGDGVLLNPGIDHIPFDTKIIPYSNAKRNVKEVADFASKVDRFEGGRFVNDSIFLIVKKHKSKSIRGKRSIIFYELNSISRQWEYKCTRKFENGFSSKRYGIFQFFYPTLLKIQNNRLFVVEAYFPNAKVSKRKLKKAFMSDDNPKAGIYEYFLQI
jgi:hypothetical protein